MGLAKASLEASVRYLAHDMGPKKFIRVNAIKAGPIKTLAASGIKGFSNILNSVEQKAALRRNITKEEIGNLAAFLCLTCQGVLQARLSLQIMVTVMRFYLERLSDTIKIRA